MKRCSTCRETKPFSDFHRNRSTKTGYAELCKSCQSAAKLRHRANDRAELYSIFGAACLRCGNDDRRVLELDHIHGGGNAEREAGRMDKTCGRKMIEYARSHKEMFQLLCANCHRIKSWEDRERRYGPIPLGETPEARRATRSAKAKAAVGSFWASLTPAERTARAERVIETKRAQGPLKGGPQNLTHCKRGHEFTAENTRLDKRGSRVCRTCVREAMRRYRAARRNG